MPAKKKAVEVREQPSTEVANFTYVDADGIEQTLDLLQVKNLGDTLYAESQKLFPNAEQCFIGRPGALYDKEGRRNLINENMVIIEARWMAKSDYSPWYLLRCAHPELGEVSVPAPGVVSCQAIEALSGIAWKDFPDNREPKGTKAGEKFAQHEFPFWARFEYVPDAGEYRDGYYVILPALQQADATPVEASAD